MSKENERKMEEKENKAVNSKSRKINEVMVLWMQDTGLHISNMSIDGKPQWACYVVLI